MAIRHTVNSTPDNGVTAGPLQFNSNTVKFTLTMTFEFEKSVNRDPANYGFSIGFVEGGTVII